MKRKSSQNNHHLGLRINGYNFRGCNSSQFLLTVLKGGLILKGRFCSTNSLPLFRRVLSIKQEILKAVSVLEKGRKM